MDAVYNLKHQYAIDDRRVYLMSWTAGSMRTSLATADVFTGFIVTYDQSWCEAIRSGNLIYPSRFPRLPAELMRDAKRLPFFLIDDKSVELAKEIELTAGAMGNRGFEHVMQIGLSSGDDVHYPNFKTEWFSEQALPFLDKFSSADRNVNPMPQIPATNPDIAPAAATSPLVVHGPSEAQSLLSKAQLLLANGQTDIARGKLEEIIKLFPNDPAAGKAKELLDQMGNP